MSRFDIHWCDVPPEDAPGIALPACDVLALWPAPVNHDACFEAAGFDDFGDNDNAWDLQARGLLGRVVTQLTRFGEPCLASTALRAPGPWYRRWLGGSRAVPLLEQLELAMHWDNLPSCRVVFGDAGASLRTGNGHVLFWITLPREPGANASHFAEAVSGGYPVIRTSLKWRTLLVAN